MIFDKKNVDNKTNDVLMRRATLLSVTIAVIIIVAKSIAWILSDSLSLLSSLVDSMLDIAASLLTFFAVRYALMPADEDHRFGHGKAEDVASLLQSAFIAGSGMFIAVEAVRRLFHPQVVEHPKIGIAVMVFSIVMTLILITYQSYVIRMTKSPAIKSDLLHYKTDLLVNILVIVSFFSVMTGIGNFIDPVMACGIAVYIFRSAWEVGKGAFDNLMDKEFDDEHRKIIIDTILTNNNVLGVHDLRTRKSGAKPFIQFHLELDGSKTLKETHKISEDIEMAVQELFPEAEVLIHQDPQGTGDVEFVKGAVVSLNNKIKNNKKEK